MTAPRVFISVGSHPTPVQAVAIKALFNTLVAAGLDPRQMEKNEWSYKQPLRAIKQVIDECDGLALVAFTRFEVSSGQERNSEGAKSLDGARMTTVWNQIEATMAFVRGMPFLVIAEKGLRDDGLLEARYDWNVYWTDFSEADFRSERFAGWVDSWKKDVVAHRSQAASNKQEMDPSQLRLRDLLGALTVAQIWGIGAAVLGAFIGVASLAYVAGGGTWPW
jgi:hypothetical protein